MKHGKKVFSLMNHMHRHHGIKFNNKKKDGYNLLLMGYFHGYKACRFIIQQKIKSSKNSKSEKITLVKTNLHIHTFKQLKQIYNLDKQLKIFLYPIITQIDTALKNYTIGIVTCDGGIYLNSIFDNCFNNYKTSSNTKQIKKIMQLKMNLEDAIIKQQPYENIMLKHYMKNNESVPLWAVFELISLGTFGYFIGYLKKPIRKQLESSLGMIDKRNDSGYTFLSKHVAILTGLRNAIAHNKVIFDCRFRGDDGIRNTVIRQLQSKCNVRPIRFNSIVDYFILMAYYQHLFKVKNSIIKKEDKHLQTLLTKSKNYLGDYRFYEIFGEKPIRKLDSLHFN